MLPFLMQSVQPSLSTVLSVEIFYKTWILYFCSHGTTCSQGMLCISNMLLAAVSSFLNAKTLVKVQG